MVKERRKNPLALVTFTAFIVKHKATELYVCERERERERERESEREREKTGIYH